MPAPSLFSKRPLADWIYDLQHAPAAENRYRALMAVHSLGKPSEAISWFRQAVRDADSSVRALAIKQLGELKRSASRATPESVWTEIASELVAALTDVDLDVRFEAARALGRIDPNQSGARDALLSLLDDDQTQPLMIAIVVSALAELSDTNSERMIVRYRKLITHDQAEVRENVSAAILKSTGTINGLIPELIAALDDDEPIVRENAAISLGHLTGNHPDVQSALQATEADEDEGVAEAARNARASLSGQ